MTATENLLHALDRLPVLQAGEVWLVGAGPGSLANLSLLAFHALAQADVVVHDALVSPEILALIPADTEKISVGKRGGKKSATQAYIMEVLIARAQAGQKVVRLKGGDPLVFGRGGEEAEELAQKGIGYRIISGMTSGLVGLAAAGIPATMRNHNQAVILATGHGAPDAGPIDWQAMARLNVPIILYMGMTNLAEIVAELQAGGLTASTPVAVVMQADTEQQRTLVTQLDRLCADVEAQGFAAPAIVMIGTYGVLPVAGREKTQ